MAVPDKLSLRETLCVPVWDRDVETLGVSVSVPVAVSLTDPDCVLVSDSDAVSVIV